MACGKDSAPTKAASSGPTLDLVMTSFFPLQSWAEFLVDGRIPVQALQNPEADPAGDLPSRQALQTAQQARLVVFNGASFESWRRQVALPPSRTVETASKIPTDQLLEYEKRTHAHGAKGEHSHEGIDGHTWMDPRLAAGQAQVLAEALSRSFPEWREELKSRQQVLDGKFAQLEQAFLQRAEAVAAWPLLANHQAYDYLARRCGWKIKNLDVDPAAALDPEAEQAIQKQMAGKRGGLMFWEEQPLASTEKTLQEKFGLESVWMNPAERPSPDSDADYFQLMDANLQRLDQALQVLASNPVQD